MALASGLGYVKATGMIETFIQSRIHVQRLAWRRALQCKSQEEEEEEEEEEKNKAENLRNRFLPRSCDS